MRVEELFEKVVDNWAVFENRQLEREPGRCTATFSAPDRPPEPRVRSAGHHIEVRHLRNAYVQVRLPAALHRYRAITFGSIPSTERVRCRLRPLTTMA
jgi:hypothetical protein